LIKTPAGTHHKPARTAAGANLQLSIMAYFTPSGATGNRSQPFKDLANWSASPTLGGGLGLRGRVMHNNLCVTKSKPLPQQKCREI
jgi:hypothetical protein